MSDPVRQAVRYQLESRGPDRGGASRSSSLHVTLLVRPPKSPETRSANFDQTEGARCITKKVERRSIECVDKLRKSKEATQAWTQLAGL